MLGGLMAKDPRIQPILLLATDFDGTLYRHGREAGHCPRFASLLTRLRADGAVWMVCSGRSLSSLTKATRQMAHEGVSPDIIVARHSWVYRQRGGLWFLQVPATLRLHWGVWLRSRALAKILQDLVARLLKSHASCRATTISPRHIRLQFADPDKAAEACAQASRLCTDPGIRLVQWQRDLELRSTPCAKAVAVLEVARHHGVAPAHTLAIGDGRSDLAMLCPAVAAMTGCPLNATREVIQAVLDARGHIADEDAPAGTIQAIEAWLDGRVSSVTPATWHPPRGDLGLGAAAAREGAQRSKGRAMEAAFLSGCVVVGLVALDTSSGAGILGTVGKWVWSVLRGVFTLWAG
jgi:HAD superfamily hydrolase (TIGR01484 family)